MYQRPYFPVFKKRLGSNRKFIQVLLGPRQVGKTTMIRQVLDKYSFPSHYASADEARSSIWLSEQWETARVKMMTSGGAEGLLVIDEIQKVPDWSNEVKIQWDKDTFNKSRLKVVLLGSSQLMIQKGLSESLAGRFETLYLPHWSFREMEEAFDFKAEEYIWYGGYPGSAGLIRDESRWKDYIRQSLVETTLMKDILLLTRIDKPALLRNLFELGCIHSGRILSYNKLLGQLHDAGNTTTLANYLRLLDGAGLLGGLEKFSREKIRQRSSSPKFQVHNQALVSALSPYSFKTIRKQPELWGWWVESAIGSHLLNQRSAGHYSLFYWRENNREVDFIIQSNETISAMEVKSGKTISEGGLEAFSKKYKPSRVLLIGQGGVGVEDFLRAGVKEIVK